MVVQEENLAYAPETCHIPALVKPPSELQPYHPPLQLLQEGLPRLVTLAAQLMVAREPTCRMHNQPQQLPLPRIRAPVRRGRPWLLLSSLVPVVVFDLLWLEGSDTPPPHYTHTPRPVLHLKGVVPLLMLPVVVLYGHRVFERGFVQPLQQKQRFKRLMRAAPRGVPHSFHVSQRVQLLVAVA